METTDVLKLTLNPTGYLIEKMLNKSLESFSKTSEKSSLQELQEDALKEEIKASVLENQAKIEQELAIARRIDSAEEVEIEEYYDVSGKAGLGINGSEEAISIGVNGEGRRITKRVVKFKGRQTVEQNDIDKV